MEQVIFEAFVFNLRQTSKTAVGIWKGSLDEQKIRKIDDQLRKNI